MYKRIPVWKGNEADWKIGYGKGQTFKVCLELLHKHCLCSGHRKIEIKVDPSLFRLHRMTLLKPD